MTCPSCASEHTMSTTKKVSTLVRWMVAGRDYATVDKEEKSVTHKCLDCGNEWAGEDA